MAARRYKKTSYLAPSHPQRISSTSSYETYEISFFPIMFLNTLFFSVAFATLAAGHGAVTSYIIGGKPYPGYNGLAPESSPETIQFQWENMHPTFSIDALKIRCNLGTSAQLSAPAQAGENVTAVWKQWTHQQGPVMVWMFKCPDGFSGCIGDTKGWFKIDQLGMWGDKLNSNNWGTAVVMEKLEWSSVIPKNLAPGSYLIRHELLSLHQKKISQFYAQCAQIVVSGEGTATPPAEYLYTIPSYAAQDDPGVTVS
ncbi:hypothetical protein OQA88_4776 [Cercophora sp. LCS_1]